MSTRSQLLAARTLAALADLPLDPSLTASTLELLAYDLDRRAAALRAEPDSPARELGLAGVAHEARLLHWLSRMRAHPPDMALHDLRT